MFDFSPLLGAYSLIRHFRGFLGKLSLLFDMRSIAAAGLLGLICCWCCCSLAVLLQRVLRGPVSDRGGMRGRFQNRLCFSVFSLGQHPPPTSLSAAFWHPRPPEHGIVTRSFTSPSHKAKGEMRNCGRGYCTLPLEGIVIDTTW